MLDWLEPVGTTEAAFSAPALVARLIGALVAGLTVAGIYRLARRHVAVAPSFPATLVLLAILVAIVTQVIGDHVARAFSLVGALSIVRFRTVVEDTFDIAFVIFAVVIGMAIGANHGAVAIGGTLVAGGAALALRPRPTASPRLGRAATLQVRVGIGHDAESVLRPVFGQTLESWHLTAGESGRQGAALDLTYQVRLRVGCEPTAVLAAVNRVDGVQRVELKCE